LDDGTKLQVEDFCQLAEKPLRDKYQGSGELCVRILRKYASEPLIEIRNLFKALLFSWWVSNGDQHLKNFSLLRNREGRWRLAPAYDLICTRLAIPSDRDLALPICGKKSNLNRQLWLEFAQYSRIPERAAARLLKEQIDALEPALRLIEASLLSDELKTQYQEIVRQTTKLLG
jgi:serine/threonine-protein kinase HipA